MEMLLSSSSGVEDNALPPPPPPPPLTTKTFRKPLTPSQHEAKKIRDALRRAKIRAEMTPEMKQIEADKRRNRLSMMSVEDLSAVKAREKFNRKRRVGEESQEVKRRNAEKRKLQRSQMSIEDLMRTRQLDAERHRLSRERAKHSKLAIADPAMTLIGFTHMPSLIPLNHTHNIS